MSRGVLVLAALALCGCLEQVALDPLGFRCEQDPDCGAGGACVLGLCREAAMAKRPLPTPHAAGNATVTLAHDATEKWVGIRWVARHTGVLAKLRLRVRVSGSVGCPYDGATGVAAGSTGKLLASTHRVRADGKPDMGAARATEELQPCGREVKEQLELNLNFPVERGEEYITLVRNTDPKPAENYFSLQFLGVEGGLQGANGRNERSPAAVDAYYGLDPRELVGFSNDNGATWALPGGPGSALPLPTYLQQFSDGFIDGQPYSVAEPMDGPVTMLYPSVPVPWRIEALGAFSNTLGTASLELWVDGEKKGAASVRGKNLMRVGLTPVDVRQGATVKVKALAGRSGLGLWRLRAQEPWDTLVQLGDGYRFSLEGDELATATVFPLPMYDLPPVVVSLTLINADTDQVVAGMDPLPQDAVLSFGSLGTMNLAIRATTHPATVGSVRFALDGTALILENNPPYAIAGDNGFGDYNPFVPSLGAHVLAVTAFAEAAGGGQGGPTLSLAFTVVP